MKNPDIYFNVMDFTNPVKTGYIKEGRINVTAGNWKNMRNYKSIDDTVLGISYTVGEHYLRGRYPHMVIISFPYQNMDVAERLIRDFRYDLERSVEYIVDKISNKYPDALIISTVAHDVWMHGDAYQFLGFDIYRPFFERCGFKDISQRTHRDIRIPTLTMVYVENMGGNAIIDNFEEFW